MTAMAARHLAIRTASPSEPSFGCILERVGLQLFVALSDAPFAEATMEWRIWSRLVRAIGDVRDARAIGKMTVTFELSHSVVAMDEGARTADGVRLGYTDQGLLVVEFLDGAGNVFAYATLTADQFSSLIGQGCDLLEIVAKGGLATVECGSLQ
jgi:hypothetical protein